MEIRNDKIKVYNVKVKLTAALMACFVIALTLAGCENTETKQKADFSGINSVCELATLKCYYHNVAKAEKEATGWFNHGYKKIWIEYSGIVELGIDVDKVSVSEVDDNGVVTVTIPKAKVLNVDMDENSMGEPLTDTGFLTKITKEEETTALAAAQDSMEAAVQENESLLSQAQNRAKNILEGYIKNVGEQIGEEYTVVWNEVE